MKAKSQKLSVQYRCESCGRRGVVEIEAARNITEREAAVRQDHDTHADNHCAGWRPRYGIAEAIT